MADAKRPPLSDSPYFWVGLFAIFALLMLPPLVTKYERRQSGLQLRHDVRKQLMESEAQGDTRAPEINPPTDDQRPLSLLWLLESLALGTVGFCGWKLWQQRRS